MMKQALAFAFTLGMISAASAQSAPPQVPQQAQQPAEAQALAEDWGVMQNSQKHVVESIQKVLALLSSTQHERDALRHQLDELRKK